MLQLITWNLSALAIAAIYYAWRDGYVAKHRKRQVLHQRVAYMLWVAASRAI
jgi:hypothetical protein